MLIDFAKRDVTTLKKFSGYWTSGPIIYCHGVVSIVVVYIFRISDQWSDNLLSSRCVRRPSSVVYFVTQNWLAETVKFVTMFFEIKVKAV